MRHATSVIAVSMFFAGCGAGAHEEPSTLAASRYVDNGGVGTATTSTSGGGTTTTATTTLTCGLDPHAMDGQSCVLGAAACRPAGWTCECAQRQAQNCGGAQMAPRLLPPAWACAPIVATADRGDGCPFAPPEDRATCSRETAECAYQLDPCGFGSANARCTHGVWAVEHRMRPPPP